jgi:hypothetical protein
MTLWRLALSLLSASILSFTDTALAASCPYMALINPFRNPIVYPSLLCSVGATNSEPSARPNKRANLWLSECVLSVATIIRMTHPTGKRLKKTVAVMLPELQIVWRNPERIQCGRALGATSGNFELDAIHRSGVSLDRRSRLLEYDVPTQVFSCKWGCIARNWACASAAAVR